MPAFIDPEATEVVDLTACYCPDSPHDHDTVTIRSQYGYGDVLTLASVHTAGIDPMRERAKLLELGIKAWSFTDAKGPVPVNMATILLLSMDVSAAIAEAIDTAYQNSQPTVPNGSSGRSQPSSPERSTASTNRATRRRAKR